MTLDQLHRLRIWHLRHWREQPVERHAWDGVLTLWLMGWVGGPAALILDLPWAEAICLAAIFLPGGYVALRRRLHVGGKLRCDWISALR